MSLSTKVMSRSHWPRVIDKVDEDELVQALSEGVITKEQYDKAYLTANKIIEELDGNIEHLRSICNSYFQTLKLRLSRN